jgi:hypothetical protein
VSLIGGGNKLDHRTLANRLISYGADREVKFWLALRVINHQAFKHSLISVGV